MFFRVCVYAWFYGIIKDSYYNMVIIKIIETTKWIYLNIKEIKLFILYYITMTFILLILCFFNIEILWAPSHTWNLLLIIINLVSSKLYV